MSYFASIRVYTEYMAYFGLLNYGLEFSHF